MSFDDELRDVEIESDPAPSPAGRLRAAAMLLDGEDLEFVAALAERLVEGRREQVRAFDERPRRMCGPERNSP